MQPFIGSRIKLYRSMAGKTQEQLSVELDVTKQHLGLIERGECNPSLDLLKKICQVLGVSPATFFLGCTCRDDACSGETCVSDDSGIIPVSACGSWTVNLDDSAISWSEALYRLIGESPQLKPSLKRFVGRIQDRFKDGFLQFYNNVLTSHCRGTICCTLTRRDGIIRAIQIEADIVTSNHQACKLALFTILDITDLQTSQRLLLHSQRNLENIVREKTKSLRQAADELQEELTRRIQAEHLLREKSVALTESEANFRSFFETVDDIFLVADATGTLLHANPAAITKTGYALEELEGMSILSLHAKDKRTVAQDMLEGMLRGECAICDLPVIAKDGRAIPVESRIWVGKWNNRPCIYGICKEQFRISSTLLRLICDNVPDMIWAKDLQKRYIFANAAICRDLLLAADTTEPIGKTDLFFAKRERLLHADNPEWHTFGELCQDSDQVTVDAKSAQRFDEYGNIKGRFTLLDVHKAPLYDDNGIMIGTVGSARDITTKRHLEQTLEQERERLAGIIEGTNVGTWEWHIETGETVFNERWAEIIGYDLDQLAPTTMDTWRRFIHPDDLRQSILLLEQHFDFETWHYEAEMRMRHKAGHWVWVLDRGKVSSWTPDGRPVVMRGTHQDITEHKEAADALRESELRLRTITNSTRDAIVVMDERGVVSFWNPAAEHILGYRAEEVLGRNLHSLLAPERFLHAHRAAFPVFLRSGQGKAVGKTVELAARHKNGQEISVELSLSAVSVRGQWQAVGILRDITERKQAEAALLAAKEQAEIANRAKSEFLANMSHEIRTPLNGILGMLQLLEVTTLNEEQLQFCSLAIQSTNRLAILLSDILDLARVEARKLLVRSEPFNLPDTITQAIDLFEPVAIQTGVTLSRHLDPDLPQWINGDALRLQQVLANLIGNAFKFTKRGHVHVEACVLPARNHETVRIFFAVSDTGCGITDDELGNLFHPFTQASQGYTRNHQGAGLGLTICKHLVSLMGGSMTVESEDGRGTTFAFCVTLGRNTHHQNDQSLLEENGTLQRYRRILLAEDDAVSAMAVKTLFRKQGLDVTHVENGRAVLDALAGDQYDLIIMDVQMPEMDGLEVTRHIRQGHAGSAVQNIPIIAMTAYAMSGDQERFLEAGMDGYIAKPLDIHALSRLIAKTVMRGTY